MIGAYAGNIGCGVGIVKLVLGCIKVFRVPGNMTGALAESVESSCCNLEVVIECVSPFANVLPMENQLRLFGCTKFPLTETRFKGEEIEMEPPLRDLTFMKAVSGILQRSERQQDLQKVINSFVDVGILPQISNYNNQIIFGRRGTGKTHILRVLASQLSETSSNAVLYIDARTLGSTSQFSDQAVPLKQRCLSLFRDILGEIYNLLLNHIVNNPTDSAEASLESLDQLGKIMTEPVSRYSIESVTSRSLDKLSAQYSIGVTLSTESGIGLTGKDEDQKSLEEEKTTSYRVAQDDKVIFPALHSLLQSVLKTAKAKLHILLDEWSSIPVDIQPYLAEFLKRSFLANPDVVIKIASLEYRSNFGERLRAGQMLGFEVGSDISTALDIDEYYVYDKNPDLVTTLFAQMLYMHLKSDLPDQYLETRYGIYSGSGIASECFSNQHVFKELVRASEGVARDLINIFTGSFFATQRKGKRHIDKATIVEVSRQWFEQDKAKNLDSELHDVLGKIIREVVAEGRARSFFLPLDLEKHHLIQRLFDARVLHLTKRGVNDRRNPGTRYNIYSLDYGTYVDLMSTEKAPHVGIEEIKGEIPRGFAVPFDDNRALKLILLPRQILGA